MAVKALTHTLDDLSKILHSIEYKIEKENKFKLEFQYNADNIQGIFIAWKRMPEAKKKRYRLYLKWVERDIERPFVELPVEIKVACAKYLPPFLHAFREFLQEKTDLMEDEIAKLKAELECY